MVVLNRLGKDNEKSTQRILEIGDDSPVIEDSESNEMAGQYQDEQMLE